MLENWIPPCLVCSCISCVALTIFNQLHSACMRCMTIKQTWARHKRLDIQFIISWRCVWLYGWYASWSIFVIWFFINFAFIRRSFSVSFSLFLHILWLFLLPLFNVRLHSFHIDRFWMRYAWVTPKYAWRDILVCSIMLIYELCPFFNSR